MQGGNTELRDSGANPLAMWHSIQFARAVTSKYDFEGSMLNNVEPFFRSFGAIQTPYFSITRDNRPLSLKLGLGLVKKVRRIGHRGGKTG